LSSLRIEIDGACKGNPGPAGIGIVIKDADGALVAEIAKPIGITTNNVAEYKALIIGMQEVLDRGADEIVVQTDSELLARQVQGRYKVSAPHLRELYQQVVALKQRFRKFEIGHSLRGFNSSADALANRGAKANENV
jgi:ribonuclease HI